MLSKYRGRDSDRAKKHNKEPLATWKTSCCLRTRVLHKHHPRRNLVGNPMCSFTIKCDGITCFGALPPKAKRVPKDVRHTLQNFAVRELHSGKARTLCTTACVTTWAGKNQTVDLERPSTF